MKIMTNRPFNTFSVITQEFGNDFPDPKTGKPYYKSNYGMYGHNGIDIIPHDIKTNRDLYNVHNGEIMYAGWDTSYGNRIKIWIKELNICEYYCHLDKIDAYIKKGIVLKERTILGKIGDTGASMGVHLHYQVCKVDEKCKKIDTDRNDKGCIKGYINPKKYLPKRW
jgi:murein DD-endopeptidase MepM/ murein hydrolase activator NlpD